MNYIYSLYILSSIPLYSPFYAFLASMNFAELFEVSTIHMYVFLCKLS